MHNYRILRRSPLQLPGRRTYSRMHNDVEFQTSCRVSEYQVTEGCAIQGAVLQEQVLTEAEDNLLETRRAGFDDLASQNVRVDDDGAQSGQLIRNGCLSRGDSTRQSNAKHAGQSSVDASAGIHNPGGSGPRPIPATRVDGLGSEIVSWAHCLEQERKTMARILWIVLAVLIVLWLVGFISNVFGGLIHILLVIALIVLVINLVTGRKGV